MGLRFCYHDLHKSLPSHERDMASQDCQTRSKFLAHTTLSLISILANCSGTRWKRNEQRKIVSAQFPTITFPPGLLSDLNPDYLSICYGRPRTTSNFVFHTVVYHLHVSNVLIVYLPNRRILPLAYVWMTFNKSALSMAGHGLSIKNISL